MVCRFLGTLLLRSSFSGCGFTCFLGLRASLNILIVDLFIFAVVGFGCLSLHWNSNKSGYCDPAAWSLKVVLIVGCYHMDVVRIFLI